MKYQEYKELSDAMEQAAHKFYQLRYQMSNGGNLSMRLDACEGDGCGV